MARILTPQDTEQVVTVTESDLAIADPDPDVTYVLRLLPDAKTREITSRHTRRVPNAQGQMIPRTDDEAVGRDILDWVLKDWTGIVARDAAGALVSVACTREAKEGLDGPTQRAIFDFARRNERVEAQARAASFRATADVLPDVG